MDKSKEQMISGANVLSFGENTLKKNNHICKDGNAHDVTKYIPRLFILVIAYHR